jgi:hypothetical protein
VRREPSELDSALDCDLSKRRQPTGSGDCRRPLRQKAGNAKRPPAELSAAGVNRCAIPARGKSTSSRKRTRIVDLAVNSCGSGIPLLLTITEGTGPKNLQNFRTRGQGLGHCAAFRETPRGSGKDFRHRGFRLRGFSSPRSTVGSLFDSIQAVDGSDDLVPWLTSTGGRPIVKSGCSS